MKPFLFNHVTRRDFIRRCGAGLLGAACGGTSLAAPVVGAAEPFLEKQNLFEARQDGYWTCRIPGLAVTRSNVVLATTEARPGKGGDKYLTLARFNREWLTNRKDSLK